MIINASNGSILSHQEIYCQSIWSQMRGLMFRKKANVVMEFSSERRIGLHMFFVFFPIDVLILDGNKKIVEIKEHFLPFTIWNSRQGGKYVVELCQKGKYNIGNKIKFEGTPSVELSKP